MGLFYLQYNHTSEATAYCDWTLNTQKKLLQKNIVFYLDLLQIELYLPSKTIFNKSK